MKAKKYDKLVRLGERIKSVESPKEIRKIWQTYFNISMHHLGYPAKTRKLLFKNFRKVVLFDNEKYKRVKLEHWQQQLGSDMIYYASQLKEDNIFENHLIFYYIVTQLNQTRQI